MFYYVAHSGVVGDRVNPLTHLVDGVYIYKYVFIYLYRMIYRMISYIIEIVMINRMIASRFRLIGMAISRPSIRRSGLGLRQFPGELLEPKRARRSFGSRDRV